MSCTLEPVIQSCDTGQWIPFFDSCQLTITWMPTIKLPVNADCKCLGHQARIMPVIITRKTYLLCSQSEHAFYCSYIIIINKYSYRGNDFLLLQGMSAELYRGIQYLRIVIKAVLNFIQLFKELLDF